MNIDAKPAHMSSPDLTQVNMLVASRLGLPLSEAGRLQRDDEGHQLASAELAQILSRRDSSGHPRLEYAIGATERRMMAEELITAIAGGMGMQEDMKPSSLQTDSILDAIQALNSVYTPLPQENRSTLFPEVGDNHITDYLATFGQLFAQIEGGKSPPIDGLTAWTKALNAKNPKQTEFPAYEVFNPDDQIVLTALINAAEAMSPFFFPAAALITALKTPGLTIDTRPFSLAALSSFLNRQIQQLQHYLDNDEGKNPLVSAPADEHLSLLKALKNRVADLSSAGAVPKTTNGGVFIIDTQNQTAADKLVGSTEPRVLFPIDQEGHLRPIVQLTVPDALGVYLTSLRRGMVEMGLRSQQSMIPDDREYASEKLARLGVVTNDNNQVEGADAAYVLSRLHALPANQRTAFLHAADNDPFEAYIIALNLGYIHPDLKERETKIITDLLVGTQAQVQAAEMLTIRRIQEGIEAYTGRPSRNGPDGNPYTHSFAANMYTMIHGEWAPFCLIGPTGCGKTTSAYAVMEYLRATGLPYPIESIRLIEIDAERIAPVGLRGPDPGKLTMNAVLRDALRDYPPHLKAGLFQQPGVFFTNFLDWVHEEYLRRHLLIIYYNEFLNRTTKTGNDETTEAMKGLINGSMLETIGSGLVMADTDVIPGYNTSGILDLRGRATIVPNGSLSARLDDMRQWGIEGWSTGTGWYPKQVTAQAYERLTGEANDLFQRFAALGGILAIPPMASEELVRAFLQNRGSSWEKNRDYLGRVVGSKLKRPVRIALSHSDLIQDLPQARGGVIPFFIDEFGPKFQHRVLAAVAAATKREVDVIVDEASYLLGPNGRNAADARRSFIDVDPEDNTVIVNLGRGTGQNVLERSILHAKAQLGEQLKRR